MKYTLIDSFCGAGGLSIGMTQAGFDLLYSFDNDPVSIATQELNFDNSHKVVLQSVNEFLEAGPCEVAGIDRGDLFLLTGGPPCQGFSIQRVGKDEDIRNDLVIRFADLIKTLLPRFYLMENVPGLMGRRGKLVFEEFERLTEQFGYSVYSSILNAEDYGVPQRRRRVIIVGVRQDLHHAPFVFPAPTHNPGRRVFVRTAIGHLPSPPLDGSDHPTIPNHRSDKLSPINLKRITALEPGQGREHLPPELLADCHRLSPSKIGHRNVYGRMDWDDVAPTITARFDSFTRGKFGHPQESRSITLREGALLQTFPQNYRFVGTKVEIARQIGNAVPPKMAYTLGEAIMDYWKHNQ